MKKASTPPDSFRKMTLNFYEAYQLVNEYIVELYRLPRKFVEEAEPAMERYMKEYGIPGSPRRNVLSYPEVAAFIDQLDDLTIEVLLLFKQHKSHFGKSAVYMKKVTMKEPVTENSTVAARVSKRELINELDMLNVGLMDIKVKADEMISKMEKLELKWFRLKKMLQE